MNNSTSVPSFKQAVTLATTVAALGASLGVNMTELMAAEQLPGKPAPTAGIAPIRTEVKQYKFYRDGTSFKLKGTDSMIIIIGGKTWLRARNGTQVPAADRTYELQDGSRLTVHTGKIVQ